MTQNERILRHMTDYGGISSLEAVSEYGIMRLASRICDLKKAGHNIVSETVPFRNRYGERGHFARYKLGG